MRVLAVASHVTRHQIVHYEVEWRHLPVRPVHGQLPQLGEGQLAVVQAVGQDDQAANQKYQGDQQCYPGDNYYQWKSLICDSVSLT